MSSPMKRMPVGGETRQGRLTTPRLLRPLHPKPPPPPRRHPDVLAGSPSQLPHVVGQVVCPTEDDKSKRAALDYRPDLSILPGLGCPAGGRCADGDPGEGPGECG